MNIPKQKFNFANTKKHDEHTDEELLYVVNNQDFLDVESYKSIKQGNNHIVQIVGWSYDVETVDYPKGTTFANNQKFYHVIGLEDRDEWREVDFNNFHPLVEGVRI